MSVPKSKRQPSQFEVFHYWYKTRSEITDLLLRDFGFSLEKAEKKILHQFGGRPYDELDDEEKVRYGRMRQKDNAFSEWFILDERKAVIDYIRNVGRCLFTANSIYPQYQYELEQRRVYQEQAIGYCEALLQELQYVINTLPVDVNKFTRYADMINQEISLIKGWRKSDNRFKKTVK